MTQDQLTEPNPIIKGKAMKKPTNAAQDHLMWAMQAELSRLHQEETPALYEAAIEQFRRVEKLFNYAPDSWPIGC